MVAIWNARQAGGRHWWFYPTIGVAIAAGVPWLTFSCPACWQYASVDLRTLDSASRRRDLKLDPVAVVSEVFTERTVREA